MRNYSQQDYSIHRVDVFLNGVLSCFTPRSRKPVPGYQYEEPNLSEAQQREVAGMMRVNHTGEVCAQALYTGQALSSKALELHEALCEAGREEEDHLKWTATRLAELNGHTSLLNPLWYSGALTLGCLAGALGDKWSLGFLEETERQVEAHLKSHLSRLPEHDTKSRAIIEQMCKDEASHANMAKEQGAAPLPLPIKWAMRMAAKVMTTVAYRI